MTTIEQATKTLMYWYVAVDSGSSHDDWAVLAQSSEDARARVLEMGATPTPADTYVINEYSLRFCVRTLH